MRRIVKNASNLSTSNDLEDNVIAEDETPYSSKYGSVESLIKQNKKKTKQI